MEHKPGIDDKIQALRRLLKEKAEQKAKAREPEPVSLKVERAEVKPSQVESFNVNPLEAGAGRSPAWKIFPCSISFF